MAELLERIADIFRTPAGERQLTELEQRDRAAVLARRRDLRRQLEALTSVLAVDAPQLRRVIENRAADVDQARQALKAAKVAQSVAEAAYCDRTTSLEAQISELRGQLVATASRQITTFLADMARLEAETRRPEALIQFETKHRLTGRKSIASNADNLSARMAAIRQARAAVEALTIEPLSELEIEQRLKELRASVPAIESVAWPPAAA
jgi:hypothetical protein